MQKFSKSTAVLEAEKGGKFQMFDGNITGEYLELVSRLKVKEDGINSVLLFIRAVFSTKITRVSVASPLIAALCSGYYYCT